MSSKPVSLGLNDKLTIDGVDMRPVAATLRGHLLCNVAHPKIHVGLTHEELAAVWKREDFRYLPEFFDAKQAEARVESGVSELHELPRRAQLFAARAYGWANDFLDLERKQAEEPKKPRSQRISRSKAGMLRAIAQISRMRDEGARDARTEGPATETGHDRPAARKRRFGSKADADATGSTSENVPSVRSLGTYVRRLEKFGTATVMRPRTDACRGAPRVSYACEALMARVAAGYASETQPTKAALYLDLQNLVREANKAAAENGSETVGMPSQRTFYRRINDLHAYTVHAARFGLKAAEKKFGSVTQGLDAKRPGQFVIVDEFRVPLQIIYIKSGVWELLTEKERKAVERMRPWVCVALDAATRVILGMTISREQSTPSVLACLRMVMTDKGQYADAVGALSPWDMAIRPEVVMTDAGSTFISDPVRAALAGLRLGNLTGAASRPTLRALIERVFGTLHTQLLSRFTGRTFANVVQKGDYDAEARASLTIDDLAWALVRYVVDQYHNSPHEGLGGETPANCWRRLTQAYPPRPLPDRHTMRSVFGFDVTRRSGPRGVRILGLFYQGKELQTYRRAHNDGMITVRIDDMNMGGVSVLLDDAWIPLLCERPGLDGVTLREWLATATALRQRHARAARLSNEIVLEAIRAIQQRANRCIEMFGLGGVRPSQRVVDQAERSLDIGWTMPGSETPDGDDADLLSGGIGSSSEAPEAPAGGLPAAPGPQAPRTPRAARPRGTGVASDRHRPQHAPARSPEPGRRPGPQRRPAPRPGTSRISVSKA